MKGDALGGRGGKRFVWSSWFVLFVSFSEPHEPNKQERLAARGKRQEAGSARREKLEKSEWCLGSCVGPDVYLNSRADCFFGCF